MGEHIPVMAEEAVAALAPRDDGLYVDATFGLGGYSRAILASANARVLGLDRDAAAIRPAAALVEEAAGRFVFIHGPFSELDDTAGGANFSPADGVVMDLGVSSPQLDTPARGFSFREDGPLDMRMDRTGGGGDASDIVNGWSEEELADIFREFGEERGARRAARAICAARPLGGTKALADVLAEALGPLYRDQPIHPATRCFQGLRIAVNDELGELGRGLAAAERLLAPGGRLAVVSFHSLEDRIVKRFMNDRAGRAPGPSRHAPAAPPGPPPSFSLLFRGAREPSAEEIAANPRARSARLRAAIRTDAPAWSEAA